MQTIEVPFFPCWAIDFIEPLNDPIELISKLLDIRGSERWLFAAFDSIASESQLWAAWSYVERANRRGTMKSKSVDTEMLRVISGTHHIKLAFERAGLCTGDSRAWLIHMPEITISQNSKVNNTEIPTLDRTALEYTALTISERLNFKLLPRRPYPIAEGLIRLGIVDSYEHLDTTEYEGLFIAHIFQSDNAN